VTAGGAPGDREPTAGGAPGGRRPTTLEEVAALAGVSRATVSRVVNDSPRVSEQAREKVLHAIAELRYMPNRAARTLVTRHAGSIALVVAEPGTRLFGEPYFAGLVRGVSQALAQGTDEQLVLLMRQSKEDSGRLERYLRNGHVDGALIVSLHGRDNLPERLHDAGLPTVLGGRLLRECPVPCVDVDNVGGARTAVGHLLATGRRRVATITGPLDMGAGVDRREGYLRAHADADAAVDERLIVEGDFARSSGYEGARRLLEQAPDLDALFAASDLMALGAMRALAEAGRSVPGDVAVIGFDDSELAAGAYPALSSVRQPMTEMGRQMTRMLLDVIDGVDRELTVTLGTELVLRDSG
jgi:DNA-binding LacI/PurR family transcriptional regulator